MSPVNMGSGHHGQSSGQTPQAREKPIQNWRYMISDPRHPLPTQRVRDLERRQTKTHQQDHGVIGGLVTERRQNFCGVVRRTSQSWAGERAGRGYAERATESRLGQELKSAAKLSANRPPQRRNMDLTPRQHELIEAARNRRRLRDHLTIEELSEFLLVSIRTIQRMHANDQGPPRNRKSQRLVYPIADLLRWLPHLGQDKADKDNRGERPGRETPKTTVPKNRL